MPCKVSIIIAVKNGGQFIAHTLESILAQDYPHIECVVVDGMSSDGTLDVVKSFEPRFAGRLKWVSDNDSGMYQAINRGISLSSGNLLGILNSDDFYHRPDSVSTIVKRLEVGDVDAVYGDVRFVRGNDLDNTVRLYSCRGFRNWMFRIGDHFDKREKFLHKMNTQVFKPPEIGDVVYDLHKIDIVGIHCYRAGYE